jgi:hypothetical protein
MRLINPLTLALPLLASAQSYPQLQSVFSKIKSYIPSAAVATTPEAVAEAARKNVIPLTLDTWQETFAASSAQAPGREWYVLVTGGNKTCSRSCDVVEKAWNVSSHRTPARILVSSNVSLDTASTHSRKVAQRCCEAAVALTLDAQEDIREPCRHCPSYAY